MLNLAVVSSWPFDRRDAFSKGIILSARGSRVKKKDASVAADLTAALLTGQFEDPKNRATCHPGHERRMS